MALMPITAFLAATTIAPPNPDPPSPTDDDSSSDLPPPLGIDQGNDFDNDLEFRGYGSPGCKGDAKGIYTSNYGF